MKITTTEFNYRYTGSYKAGHGNEAYVRHDVTVCNVINIDGEELEAVYLTGLSYDDDDYDCPSPRLALDFQSDYVLFKLDELYEEDFEKTEFINETLEVIRGYCPPIDTVEKLKRAYDALNDNLPSLSHHLDEKYTDNLDDYIEKDGKLELK